MSIRKITLYNRYGFISTKDAVNLRRRLKVRHQIATNPLFGGITEQEIDSENSKQENIEISIKKKNPQYILDEENDDEARNFIKDNRNLMESFHADANVLEPVVYPEDDDEEQHLEALDNFVRRRDKFALPSAPGAMESQQKTTNELLKALQNNRMSKEKRKMRARR